MIESGSKSFMASGVLDQYTPIIGGSRPEDIQGVPKWVPMSERRRTFANMVLDQFVMNADPMPQAQIDSDMTPRRLGEVAYTVGVLRDVTIGGHQQIKIEGQDLESAEASSDSSQLKAMTDWSKRSLFLQKVQQGEEFATTLGETYFRLRVSGVRGGKEGEQDVRIDLFHPTFVFPQYDQNDELESCALMWEESLLVKGNPTAVLFKDEYTYGPDGAVYETAAWYELSSAPSLSDLKLVKFDTTSTGEEINALKLASPKIPVFHLMNLWKATNHGESDFAANIDLIREMNAAATDLAAAASLLGIPPLVISGLKAKIREGKARDDDSQDTVGAGQIWHVDSTGKAAYLDNTALLDCLLKYSHEIEKKLFTHLRLPKLFGGDTDNLRDIESARAMKMLLASLYARVSQKRSMRNIFYAQLLDAVAVMLTATGKLSAPTPTNLTLDLGSILPLDNAQDIDIIVSLWAQGKGPISTETAVRMAKNAGVPVVDSAREVQAITEQVKAADAGGAAGAAGGTKPPFALGKRTPKTPSKAA